MKDLKILLSSFLALAAMVACEKTPIDEVVGTTPEGVEICVNANIKPNRTRVTGSQEEGFWDLKWEENDVIKGY